MANILENISINSQLQDKYFSDEDDIVVEQEGFISEAGLGFVTQDAS